MRLSKQAFQQHKRGYEVIMLLVFFLINGVINASTVVMEAQRDSGQTFQNWEPYVWELSSAFSSLLLFPMVAYFLKEWGWRWAQPLASAFRFLLAGVAFALIHVALMVAMRESVYLFTNSDYSFAKNVSELVFELVYELRKDLWSFFLFVVIILSYRQLVEQWLGDATYIKQGDDNNRDEAQISDTLLIKKLGKSFLVKRQDVDWVESAGNYVNLHVDQEVYPMRCTLKEFVAEPENDAFIRTHRSYAVNRHFIKSISKSPSGDGSVELTSGTHVKLSRRYPEVFDLGTSL